MQYPTLIRARQLNEWAGSSPAKSLLPELIGRLVSATVPEEHLQRNDFPAEAETHRAGYDGTTVTNADTRWVPKGICYWELGCEKDPEKKGQEDYSKRIEEHEIRVRAGESEDLSQATFSLLRRETGMQKDLVQIKAPLKERQKRKQPHFFAPWRTGRRSE